MKFTHFVISLISLMSGYAQTELEATEDTALVHLSITDKKGLPEENAKVTVTSVDGKIKKEAVTDISGKFDILLPEGKKYKILVRKFGKNFEFYDPNEQLDVPSMDGTVEFDQHIAIWVITDYLKVFVVDIHFTSGKHDLNENSKRAADAIFKMLEENKTMKIEIAGHTDNVGDDAHNLKLSQLRANAVRDYLFSLGIAHDRIVSKGYGETHPVAPNDTEVGRVQNRRTEVKVISE